MCNRGFTNRKIVTYNKLRFVVGPYRSIVEVKRAREPYGDYSIYRVHGYLPATRLGKTRQQGIIYNRYTINNNRLLSYALFVDVYLIVMVTTRLVENRSKLLSAKHALINSGVRNYVIDDPPVQLHWSNVHQSYEIVSTIETFRTIVGRRLQVSYRG